MVIIVIGIDFETMTIPDRFSIGGALGGLVLSFCFPSLHGLSEQPIMIESVFVFHFPYRSSYFLGHLYWIGAVAGLMNKEALGQGDVKLLGFVGAFCGWQGGLFVIFGEHYWAP